MLYNQIFWTALSLSLLLMAQMANGGNGYNESEDDKDSLYLPLLAHGANGDNESEDDKAETSSAEEPHIADSGSEDRKSKVLVEISLSQATLFLIKMENFFDFNDCNYSSNYNKKKSEKFVKCPKELKIAGLQDLFGQNATQNDQIIGKISSSVLSVDSNQLMKLLLVKSMQKINNPSNSLEKLRNKFANFLEVTDLLSPNVFETKEINELTIEQNLSILHELLLFSIDHTKNQKMLVKHYGEQKSILINDNYYNIYLEEKFIAISEEISRILLNDFNRNHFSNNFSDLKIQITWIEREETMPEKIDFLISMKKIAQMLEKIGLFILSNCNQHLWYFENEFEEIKNCANRINFDELAEIFPKNEQKKLFNLFVIVLRPEETVYRAKILEMSSQHIPLVELRSKNSPFDEHILYKISDYHNNIKVSILIGLLQFGRIFTEEFGTYAVKKLYLGLNVEMLWKNFAIHINMIDHPGEEMDALERFLKSAGLV